VIDSQLQETLENFERRKGVVASITNAGAQRHQWQALRDDRR
jgi:hypothetical protein